MQQNASGPVPPKPIRPAMPTPPHRRAPSKPDRRFVIITEAVTQKGAAYDAEALAEETGIPADGIRRIAAQFMVDREMVELGMIEFEDGIRMGSEALAASLRIVGKRHDSIERKAPARTLRTADVMGLRRADQRAPLGSMPVTAPQTLCSRCGGRADAQGGCAHQHLVRVDNSPIQGLPHA